MQSNINISSNCEIYLQFNYANYFKIISFYEYIYFTICKMPSSNISLDIISLLYYMITPYKSDHKIITPVQYSISTCIRTVTTNWITLHIFSWIEPMTFVWVIKFYQVVNLLIKCNVPKYIHNIGTDASKWSLQYFSLYT